MVDRKTIKKNNEKTFILDCHIGILYSKEIKILKNGKTTVILHPHQQKRRNRRETYSYENLVELSRQYKEYRIFSKNGDILKSYIAPVKKWINIATDCLLRIDQNTHNECHQLLVDFEKYASITDPPRNIHS